MPFLVAYLRRILARNSAIFGRVLALCLNPMLPQGLKKIGRFSSGNSESTAKHDAIEGSMPKFRMKVGKSKIVALMSRTLSALLNRMSLANRVAVSGLIARSVVPLRFSASQSLHASQSRRSVEFRNIL